MDPTLKVGDRVLVEKVLTHPHRGWIIVFSNPNPTLEPHRNWWSGLWHWLGEGFGVSQPENEDFIKRVIGLPGDTVEERPNGDIYVNGHRLVEPYLKGPKDVRPQGLPTWHVPKDELFVLGDNRTNSNDSRFQGGGGVNGALRRTRDFGTAGALLWAWGAVGDGVVAYGGWR